MGIIRVAVDALDGDFAPADIVARAVRTAARAIRKETAEKISNTGAGARLSW